MKATRMNDLEIRRVVYGMLQAGLVDIIRPVGNPIPPLVVKPTFPTQNKEEQKSLISRIIARIRSL
jgi:hypothetical protein